MQSNNHARSSAIVAALLAGVACLPAPAFAQAAPATKPPVADADPSASQEIVVTALRGAARQVDVPASVTAVSGAALATAGVKKFQDLAVVAPGVQVSRSGSYTQPSIRGVSTTFAGGGQETNVAVYVDGFYTSDQLSINQDFANVQDVQVLKGPQGTLYGRNATGGAILITTRGPSDTLVADGSVSYAPRYNDRQFSAFTSGPITKGIEFSIAGYYRKTDGYIKDINNFAPNVVLDPTTYTFGGNGFQPLTETSYLKRSGNNSAPFENWSVRPKLLVELSPDVRVTLAYVHNYINDPRAFAYQIVGAALNPAASYNGYPVANQRDRTSLNFQPKNESKSDEFNATVEVGLGDLGKLTSRSAYRKQRDLQVYDLDATPNDAGSNPLGTAYIGIQNNTRRTFTQQLDYNGQFGALTILAGAFYYRDKFATPNAYEDIGTATNPVATTLFFNTRSYAGYVDATYAFGGHFFVTAGARYSRDEKTLNRFRYSQSGLFASSESTVCYSDAVNPVYIGPTPSTPTAAAISPLCSGSAYKSDSNNAFTPHIVARYKIDDDTNVYGSVSRGFKAGTINTAPNYNSLKPETVTAYELGFKTNQGPLHAELAGFYYDYKNNQVSALDPNSPTITTKIQNSGGAHIYGVDATLSYRIPQSGLNFRVGLEYLHARYTNFANATNVILGPTGTNTSVIGSWTGRRLQRAPDFSGSVGADYTARLLGGKLVTSGTVAFSTRYSPQNASYQCTRVSRNAAGADIPFVAGTQGFCAAGTDALQKGRFEENGYVLGNVQIAWTDPSNRYTVTVFSDNVTGTRYKIISSAFAYESYDEYNEPRTIGVKFGFKY
ncbi:TonB-dependent receptor [Sphingomonas bacterium]|uniref:TonB-dependent receptor n=1 Tax=Sphingomonas bacterium TaxID=1895847 RepID=UPI001576247C|nr:TonB-dependent receptor [Sphingomonas bacterium]